MSSLLKLPSRSLVAAPFRDGRSASQRPSVSLPNRLQRRPAMHHSGENLKNRHIRLLSRNFRMGGGKPIKIFYRGGQLFVYWGPIISSVYSIYATDRKGKRNFLYFYQFACENILNFYQFPSEIFQFLSISKRNFSVFVNFNAKYLNIYLFRSQNFQFLSIFMRNFWIFIKVQVKFFTF